MRGIGHLSSPWWNDRLFRHTSQERNRVPDCPASLSREIRGGYSRHRNPDGLRAAAPLGSCYDRAALFPGDRSSCSQLGLLASDRNFRSAVVCECYFFIPPVFSFDVADTRSYVSLIVFEVSALLVSRLSAREQSNARDAEAQRRSMSRLYELSSRTQQLDLHHPPGSQLVNLVRELFAVDAIAIFASG